MSYTNKTPVLGLPQYLDTDLATWTDNSKAYLLIDEFAASANAGIQKAQETAEQGVQDAATADAKAVAAQAAADKAQTTADNAMTEATTAHGIADNALTAANNAAGKADTAQSTAEAAQGAARTAQTAANNAQTSATNAMTRANNAYTLAENTQTSLNGLEGTVNVISDRVANYVQPTLAALNPKQLGVSVNSPFTQVPYAVAIGHFIYLEGYTQNQSSITANSLMFTITVGDVSKYPNFTTTITNMSLYTFVVNPANQAVETIRFATVEAALVNGNAVLRVRWPFAYTENKSFYFKVVIPVNFDDEE